MHDRQGGCQVFQNFFSEQWESSDERKAVQEERSALGQDLVWFQ